MGPMSSLRWTQSCQLLENPLSSGTLSNHSVGTTGGAQAQKATMIHYTLGQRSFGRSVGRLRALVGGSDFRSAVADRCFCNINNSIRRSELEIELSYS